MDFDFNIPGNGGQQIDIRGTFFKYKQGLGAIKVQTSRGESVTLLPGQGMRNTPFDRLQIVDASGLPNSGILIASESEFIDDRISGSVSVVGSLTVTDISRSRALNGTAFIGRGVGSPAVGNVAEVQLFNPLGSGKNCFIERLIFNTVGAQAMVMKAATVALVTNSATPPQNKNLNGAASAMQVRLDSIAALVAQPWLGSFNMSAAAVFDYVPKAPFLLVPGTGLTICSDTANAIFNMDFEHYEE